MIRSIRLTRDGRVGRDLPPEEFRAAREAEGLLWIDLAAPSPEEVKIVADAFGFHPLAVEDCLHRNQFPKLDDYGDHLFVVAHSPEPPGTDADIRTRDVEMFLGRNFLVTHHDRPISAVDELLDRCGKDAAHVLGRGPAEVAHLLLDRMVDDFRPVLDALETSIERLEDEVLRTPGRRTLAKISRLKRDLLHLRRVVWPARDVINRLARDPHPLIPPEVRPYFRDVYDHLTRVAEESEIYRDLISGLRDTYIAMLANRTNEVIKTLTLIAAALLPVNVLAAIYGMNFEWLPPSKEAWGFPAMLGLMAAASGTMIWFFRRTRWL